MWTELGIGDRVVKWLDTVAAEDPGLLCPGHPLRTQIDSSLGRLVGHGVPAAHEHERRVEAARNAPAAVSVQK